MLGCAKTKLTVFLELRSRKNVRIPEQIMSADKYIVAYFRAKLLYSVKITNTMRHTRGA